MVMKTWFAKLTAHFTTFVFFIKLAHCESISEIYTFFKLKMPTCDMKIYWLEIVRNGLQTFVNNNEVDPLKCYGYSHTLIDWGT